MLIAMLTVFLLGGGLMGGTILNPAEVDAISERVELSVGDPARLSAATALLDELKTDVENFDKVFAQSGEELIDLYRDHGADSRKMLKNLEALNLEWYVSQYRSIKLRDKLKQSITADEWAEIFGDQ
ncbi:MAG: hypothetical protein OEU50_16335 [Gammaproteobacteria bacterium]|nr:hypothetical protein [Gammaproteobacteria bacterium]